MASVLVEKKSLMAQLISALRQEEPGLASCKSHKKPQPWSDGSLPLVPRADNVIAEAHACLAAVQLAIEYHRHCLERGMSQDGIVIQGDILPLVNYLQGKGRAKRLAVVSTLGDCQRLLSLMPPSSSGWSICRECNKLAEHFAGQASAKGRMLTNRLLSLPIVRCRRITWLRNSVL